MFTFYELYFQAHTHTHTQKRYFLFISNKAKLLKKSNSLDRKCSVAQISTLFNPGGNYESSVLIGLSPHFTQMLCLHYLFTHIRARISQRHLQDNPRTLSSPHTAYLWWHSSCRNNVVQKINSIIRCLAWKLRSDINSSNVGDKMQFLARLINVLRSCSSRLTSLYTHSRQMYLPFREKTTLHQSNISCERGQMFILNRSLQRSKINSPFTLCI